MNELVATVSVVVWLLLGGWSFRSLMKQADGVTGQELGALFLFCLILAPFAAGMALCSVEEEHP